MAWQIANVDESAVGTLARALRVRPLTARCLAVRGLSSAGDAREFLDPRLRALRPPQGLAGLEQAVGIIGEAVQSGKLIGVFGDYDVDGVTTTALISSFLRQLGGRCVARVARRHAGYGFGLGDVEHFAAAGCQLIITGDCGTSDVAAIEEAARRGIEVVVVDHHTVPEVDPEKPHPAAALVNPFRVDSTFPFQGMASVGLGFYMMAALRTRLRESGWLRNRPEPDVRELLDLVALGTVADLVPLRRENRILTRHGLELLRRLRRPGIAALARAAGMDRQALAELDEETVSWKLAPRLNAPGRLGDAAPALTLLLAPDPERAEAGALELEAANERRRAEQARVLEEALAIIGDRDPGPAVVVAGEGWASGVVGIVAAKLVERYRRPAFVIALDRETGIGRGSARSHNGVNLYRVLHSARHHLDRFGGHAAAAGLTVRAAALDAARDSLQMAVADEAAASRDRSAEDVLDAEAHLSEIDRRLTEELGRLGPFGRGNERPRLLLRGLVVTESRRVGDGSHLKLELRDRMGVAIDGIAFRQGDRDPGQGGAIDVVATPIINSFRGRRQVELQIDAFDVLRRGVIEIDSRAPAAEPAPNPAPNPPAHLASSGVSS